MNLSSECFRGCSPGELVLNDEEIALVSASLQRLTDTAGVLPPSLYASVCLVEASPGDRLARRSRSRSRSGNSKISRKGSRGGKKDEKRPAKQEPAVKLEPVIKRELEPDLPMIVPDLASISWESCQVIEVDTMQEKRAAYDLHMMKHTFQEERPLVEYRIFRGDICNCRTWILIPSEEGPAGSDLPEGDSSGRGRGRGRARGKGRGSGAKATQVLCLAAVTVRINRYSGRQGRWAQILNMSTRRERHSFGTVLIAGLEELLRREDTDVVVLYPAENGRAPPFWSSLGFGARSESHLPEEELVPHDKGGPLLPEFDPGSQAPLPRWEKRLVAGPSDDSDEDGGKKKGPAKTISRGSKSSDYRVLPASASRLAGEALMAATAALKEQRARLKAALISGPPDGLGVQDANRLGALRAHGGV